MSRRLLLKSWILSRARFRLGIALARILGGHQRTHRGGIDDGIPQVLAAPRPDERDLGARPPGASIAVGFPGRLFAGSRTCGESSGDSNGTPGALMALSTLGWYLCTLLRHFTK